MAKVFKRLLISIPNAGAYIDKEANVLQILTYFFSFLARYKDKELSIKQFINKVANGIKKY